MLANLTHVGFLKFILIHQRPGFSSQETLIMSVWDETFCCLLFSFLQPLNLPPSSFSFYFPPLQICQLLLCFVALIHFKLPFSLHLFQSTFFLFSVNSCYIPCYFCLCYGNSTLCFSTHSHKWCYIYYSHFS